MLRNFDKKLKYLAPYNVRKHLAECLILSKIDYNDIVSDTIADYLVKRLQRVQLAAAKLSSWSSRYNYVTRRTLHQSLRKWKESQASFNFPPTWCGSAGKRQLEKRNKLQDLKLLRNLVCTEEAEIP